jgi:polysaccharide biosynthesis PFTS motif protein
MLWKRKRKIGSIAHPRYRIFAERLSEAENVIIVDPDISANRVIEASSLVISMPFTSTALIARELGKPSCYYDPTGLVQKDDRAAHGIEIISGPEELKEWLKNIPVESHLTEATG